MNIFEYASRNKLRFESSIGLLTAEDLWALPLTSKNKVNLNDIGVALRTRIRAEPEESLVETTVTKNVALEVAFDIVKHIIDVKKVELAERQSAAERAAKIKLLTDLKTQKEIDDLGNKSIEDLQKEIDALKAATS